MTPKQFKKARKDLGLSTSQLGLILNVNPRTVRKWEKDDNTRPPNPIACRVVQWMLRGYCPPEMAELKGSSAARGSFRGDSEKVIKDHPGGVCPLCDNIIEGADAVTTITAHGNQYLAHFFCVLAEVEDDEDE